MPDQAFSKISSLAGPEVPARHQTLNEFLKLTITLPFDRGAVVAAVERHPELLKQCLAFADLAGAPMTDWHRQISDQGFCDLALMLANSTSREGMQASHWQRGRLSQLISEGLSASLGFAATEQKRLGLLALLLDVGHRELDVKGIPSVPRKDLLVAEQSRCGTTGDQFGAAWLSSRGFAPGDCDVLRYQYEALETLLEASMDLFVVALAGRVADSILSNFDLTDEFFDAIEQRAGLSHEQIRKLLEQAYTSLRVENDLILARHDFDQILAQANLAQQFLACQSQSALLDLASECFGVSAIAAADVTEDALQLDYLGEAFQVLLSSNTSLLARAYAEQTPFSAEENALAAIVDKQILSRMAANALWVIPSPTGVMVCAAIEPVTDNDEFLTAAFSRAMAQQFTAETEHEQRMIGVDEVQSRVRELTHEVNNPLAIVQNYLKTLSLRLGADNSAQGDIKTISDEMLRIGKIIQRYADIGQDSDVEVEHTNINQAISELVGIVAGANEQLDIRTMLDDSIPELAVPQTEFKQVLLNLMKNAAEAMAHQMHAELVVRTQGQINLNGAHYVEVVISDNGPGIPANIYQNLFLANKSSKGEGHSGLGLTVANRLVMEMGGYISCRSSDRGTQFQILLPTNNSPTNNEQEQTGGRV